MMAKAGIERRQYPSFAERAIPITHTAAPAPAPEISGLRVKLARKAALPGDSHHGRGLKGATTDRSIQRMKRLSDLRFDNTFARLLALLS